MTELAFPEIDAARADVATIPTATLKDTALASFVPIEQHMRTLAARYANVAYDVATPKGMKDAKAARLVLRDEGRYAVQRLQKRLKDEANDLKRTLDSKADELIAITMPVEAAIDGQITAEETRKEAEREEKARIERERVAALEAKLSGLSVWIERCKAPGMTSERIAAGIKMLQDAPIVAEDWAEFLPRALARKAEVLEVMADMCLAAEAREAEAARLEAQRLENERVAAEQRAEAERLAEQQRQLAEQAAELQRKVDAIAAQERLAEERQAALLAEQELIAARAAKGEAENPAPADAPAEAAPITQDAQVSGFVPGTPGLCTSNGAEAAEAPPSGLKGQGAHAEDRAPYPARTKCVDPAACRGYKAGSDCWATCGGLAAAESFDYIPPSSTVDEPRAQTEAEIQGANGPEVDLPDPETLLPHAYLLAKLAMVMPLFQEARDALTAITEAQRKRSGISATLAARMDVVGTFSVDDWLQIR